MSNKEKKVVIAAEIWPPDIGGPATYAKKLAEELTRRHFRVEVVTYADKSRSNYELVTSERSYRVTRVNRRTPLPFRYWVYLGDLLRISWGAEVIYAQGPLSAGWPAMWVKRLTGRRVVVKVVGDQAWERAYQAGKTHVLTDAFQKESVSGKIRSIRNIQHKVLKYADAVISVSHYFKKIIADWEVNEEKIFVVHNSVEEFDAPESADIGLEGDIILSVGRLTKWKGMDTLIELMPALLKENPHFKLVIIGGGPESDRLKKIVERLNLSDAVLLTGKLPRPQLAQYYQKASMLVLNSGYDNWSHILLEAMNNGVPVIASNIGGNPELVKDGVTGLIVEYNDKVQLKTAISRIWLNEHLAYQLSSRAKKEVSQYTFTDLTNRTVDILLKNN